MIYSSLEITIVRKVTSWCTSDRIDIEDNPITFRAAGNLVHKGGKEKGDLSLEQDES